VRPYTAQLRIEIESGLMVIQTTDWQLKSICSLYRKKQGYDLQVRG